MTRRRLTSVLAGLLALSACEGGEVASTGPAPGGWRLSGSPLVRPTEIHDDGAHIFVSFADDQELPAVFGLTPGGEETLVNGHMRAGTYVIDELYPSLIFRLGRDVARASKGRR